MLLPKVSDYFRNLSESLYVQFKVASSGEDLITSRLSLRTPWNVLIDAVAEKLGAPSTHVRLHIGDDRGEDVVPLKSAPTLHEALVSLLPENATTEGVILWVEVTPMPVAELESMKRIRLTLVNGATDGEEANTFVYVGLRDTPKSIHGRLPTTFQAASPYRLIETHHHRIIREYIEEDSLAPLGETSQVYLEGPISSIELSPTAHLISVFSYNRDVSRTHARPFRLLLLAGEPFSLTKERIAKRLSTTLAAMSAWTYSIVSHGKARPVEDDDVLASCLSPSGSEQLGINRPDPNAVASVRSGAEKSIKIRSSTPSATKP